VPDDDNRVLTVVMHPSQDHHVVRTPLDHYSLYGLYEDVLGLPHDPESQADTGDGSMAGSMAEAFGLPLDR
jgi:hypothetical protein